MPLNVTRLSKEKESTANFPRILLVEDTHMIQYVAKSLLNDAGFVVDIASTGEEAYDMFLPGKYDLIYMDIGLPKMNGYETAQAIRTKEKAVQAITPTPIIALTGHGAVDVQQFCSAAGMQGVLSKPLSREQAEKIWKHFNEDATVFVPGLILLAHTTSESDKTVLDLDATIKAIGFKEAALKLIPIFVEELKNQFLPQIKRFLACGKNEGFKFLLHQQLGSLAYIKAPRLEKTLSDIQTMVQKDISLPPTLYQNLEQEVLCIITNYKKMNLVLLQAPQHPTPQRATTSKTIETS